MIKLNTYTLTLLRSDGTTLDVRWKDKSKEIATKRARDYHAGRLADSGLTVQAISCVSAGRPGWFK